ncbi:MAG TPA: bifunctional YncE family protein/alkaline phosphatase family protein [Steroidobacteraceae bacterium]|nr:bifunctional YncE family protein/alkaline phosphatase family protein [Steroidobacteraceae bacterium]
MMSHRVPAGRCLARLALLTLIGLLPHGAARAKAVAMTHRAPDAPSGIRITPTAAAGARFSRLNPGLPGFPGYVAGQAVTTVTSPDGKTLLILTSGFNKLYDKAGARITAASNEYVFVYDISHDRPVRRQVLLVPNTYVGVVFAPDGRHFYVSGGVDDDVHVFARRGSAWFEETGALVELGHGAGKGLPPQPGALSRPEAAGLAVTADAARLIVSNFYNDSLSIVPLVDGVPGGRAAELSLQPGHGGRGGTYPLWVAVKGNQTAYVSSVRDREVDMVSLAAALPAVVGRIAVEGNPSRMVLNRAGSRLYVVSDNADVVSVIDTATNRIEHVIRTIAPPALMVRGAYYHGVAPNSVSLSPDEKRLYVTNGGENAVAVIALDTAEPQVTGLIPTGYWPNSVSVSADGRMLYVVNGRSIPGPNAGDCASNDFRKSRQAHCVSSNQYILQLSKAGFLDLPAPEARDLAELTRTVAANDHLYVRENAEDRQLMQALHQRIKHIIYIVRENRTYDQILGDLPVGNGDPRLTEFGHTITPNAHALAKTFVTLDNFYDTGEVSGNGWPWSTSAMESDLGVKNLPVNYADRGLSYDWEGTNRDVDVAIGSLAERKREEPGYPDDPNLLPGTANAAAPDGPEGEREQGYVWDAAMRAGLSVRNYGFMLDLLPYHNPTRATPLLEWPRRTRTQVAFPANRELARVTDPYFRGFDTRFPDYFREAEWQREFQRYLAKGNLPALSLVRLMRDHLGEFAQSIDGLSTPEAQVADNDYAVGRLIEAVARSPYADSTLIIIIEDDAQDGPDHVDAHRSVCFLAGPYLKHHAVVSERYSTVNVLATIEDILGIDHLSIYDAYQRPMSAVFDLSQKAWTFEAAEPAPFAAAFMGGTRASKAAAFHFTQTPAYWARVTRGMRWDREDENPAPQIERIYWKGLKPGLSWPKERSGEDLRRDRGRLLTSFEANETTH